MKLKLILVLIVLISGFTTIFPQELKSIILPTTDPVLLNPYAHLNFSEINESSGLVKSRLWTNVFWTHNDSGDKPRIFPITKDGNIIKPEWAKNYAGILIPDAVNVDWESITTDDQGNLIIGDCGNNSSIRRDLTLYIIKEPFASQTVKTCISGRIKYYYEDQTKIPPLKKNYDAEAIFWRHGKIYILTKHRSDSHTKLYKLDSTDPLKENKACIIQEFDIHGQVTGAEASIDGKKVAVLTTNAIWLFEPKEGTENIFDGKISYLPIKAKQCESVCFDEENIIIGNEQGELFQIKQKDLITISID